MAGRVSPPSPPGSLFKGETPKRTKKKDMGRAPRAHDAQHLEDVRQCPCLKCGIDPAGEAAHIRMTRDGKPITGMGAKPDDKYALPLCHSDHMEQHRVGELAFWREVGIDPLKVAERLYAAPGVEAMRAMCFAAQAIAATEA